MVLQLMLDLKDLGAIVQKDWAEYDKVFFELAKLLKHVNVNNNSPNHDYLPPPLLYML